jgi:hypothetical protein
MSLWHLADIGPFAEYPLCARSGRSMTAHYTNQVTMLTPKMTIRHFQIF